MQNIRPSETILPRHQPRSLAWVGDSLVDWVSGGVMYHLDGGVVPAVLPEFAQYSDAVVSPNGEFAAVFAAYGTEGVLMRRGRVVRELTRGVYRADVNQFPVCLFEHVGRTLLAHCPEVYCRLQISDAETGECLSHRDESDSYFFHARISASPDGARLLSSGWIWCPLGATVWFDVASVLNDPRLLDSFDGSREFSRNVCLAEDATACWQNNTTVLITATDDAEDPTEAAEADAECDGERLRTCGIIAYDTIGQRVLSSCVLSQPAGIVMAVGTEHALALYQHPRLVRLRDGDIMHEWPHINSGTETSTITWGKRSPVMACDPVNARFAIVQEGGIHVLSF